MGSKRRSLLAFLYPVTPQRAGNVHQPRLPAGPRLA